MSEAKRSGERIRVKKPDLAHGLFALTLLTLLALGVWWMGFFARAVDIEKEAKLDQLRHAAQTKALLLGHASEPPRLGPCPGREPLELELLSGTHETDAFPLHPSHPEFGIRPAPHAVEAVLKRQQRRKLMVFGESTLLFALFGVCSVMLFRLVGQDRRHLLDMESFTAAVTHEMKTPLTGIKSLLQTVAAGLAPLDQQSRLFALGLKETERLERMIENVLVSGHLRSGHFEVRMQHVVLGTFLASFVEQRRRYLFDRPESLSLMMEPGLETLEVLADPHAMQIVLENLVDNAFKYGGTNPEVLVGTALEDAWALIRVEDRGIGFDQRHAERLFDAYHRQAPTLGGARRGTGLGLPIARSLARRMEGDLLAQSPGQDQGSCFTLRLRKVEP